MSNKIVNFLARSAIYVTSTMVKLSSFNFHLVIKSSNMSYTLYFLTFSILFVQILALFFYEFLVVAM